jgi:hypothetical protein
MVPPTICVLCRYLSFIHLAKSAAMALNSLCSTTLGSVTYFIFSLKIYAKSREKKIKIKIKINKNICFF